VATRTDPTTGACTETRAGVVTRVWGVTEIRMTGGTGMTTG
jgi:hypothetical protein